MRLRLFIAASVVCAAAAPAVVRATQSQSHTAAWQWRSAVTTHAPRQLVSTTGVVLLGSGGTSDLHLLVEADGRFVQKVRSAATDDAPVAAFVVADAGSATETVVGVVRSDIARLILRGSNGEERQLPLNELGAFAAAALPAGTSWQLDALAADGSSLSHLSLPQAAAPCGGAVGPCRVATGRHYESMYPASPLTTVATSRVAGRLWKLQTYFNRRGNSCVQLTGDGGVSRTCSPGRVPAKSFTPVWGTERSAGTAGWSRLWIFGKVAPSVRRMTLLRECGGEVFNFPSGLRTQRWFLRVYTGSRLSAGGMPVELSMRDAAGVIVSNQHISLSISPTAPSSGPSEACSAKQRAWALSQARRAAFHRARTLPHAFRRAARPSDRLPSRLARIVQAGPSGATPDRVVASRLVATYIDARGRRAALYLIESLRQVCTITTWGTGASGGCNPIDDPFGGRHMIGGSGHLYSGVVDDSVARVVVVGTLGVRHPVSVDGDRAFIYDCKAYNGCSCVVSRVEAYNKNGKLIESERLGTGCRKPSAASASVGRPDYTKKNGTVSWLFNHQPRGASLAAAGIRLTDTVGSHWQPVRFARVVQPNPRSSYRVVLSLIGKRGRNICMTEFLGRTALSGGCAIGLGLKPFTFTTGSSDRGAAGSAARLITGVASDDVARMALAFEDGHATLIPFKNNVFIALLPKASTARLLVAYDRQGRVMRMTRIPAPIGPLG